MYIPPDLDLLDMPVRKTDINPEEDEALARCLEETLASFKVQARVVHVTHGPAISRFELELAAGTKVNKVSELEKDIAYAMSATAVRIEAPIPGKRLVGVEVPNRKVRTVTLREVLESEPMPIATVRIDFAFCMGSLSMTSRRVTVVTFWFGTSTPTRRLPGIGASMRTEVADMP